jgi:hypothetical protein
MNSRRPLRVLLVCALTFALLPMLSTMSPATADQTWYQSVGRTSSDAPCEESPTEDLAAGWTQWSPSWEQWANGAAGGFVCSRQITWARTPDSGDSGGSTPRTYALGDIGPGGGLVFLISGGLTYEMASKSWGANETTYIFWCDNGSSSVSTGLGVGTGSANTTAMLALPCISGAGVSARAYNGGGFTDWFLPSQDELNQMWLYSQISGFNSAQFGFAGVRYWSSSEPDNSSAYFQNFADGVQGSEGKFGVPLYIRPVRAF